MSIFNKKLLKFVGNAASGKCNGKMCITKGEGKINLGAVFPPLTYLFLTSRNSHHPREKSPR